jgi:hypothetical protein
VVACVGGSQSDRGSSVLVRLEGDEKCLGFLMVT